MGIAAALGAKFAGGTLGLGFRLTTTATIARFLDLTTSTARTGRLASKLCGSANTDSSRTKCHRLNRHRDDQRKIDGNMTQWEVRHRMVPNEYAMQVHSPSIVDSTKRFNPNLPISVALRGQFTGADS